MKSPPSQFRFRAVSMELAAHLNEKYVEMRVVTHDGTTITIECENDSIFAVQRNIEKLSRECPEVRSWISAADAAALGKADRDSCNAAVSEGWHDASRAA